MAHNLLSGAVHKAVRGRKTDVLARDSFRVSRTLGKLTRSVTGWPSANWLTFGSVQPCERSDPVGEADPGAWCDLSGFPYSLVEADAKGCVPKWVPWLCLVVVFCALCAFLLCLAVTGSGVGKANLDGSGRRTGPAKGPTARCRPSLCPALNARRQYVPPTHLAVGRTQARDPERLPGATPQPTQSDGNMSRGGGFGSRPLLGSSCPVRLGGTAILIGSRREGQPLRMPNP